MYVRVRDFSKLNNIFNKNSTIVVGISKDTISSHIKFKKYKLKFDLLSDDKLKVIKNMACGVRKSF